jgi:hypothetical protein
MKLKSEHRMYFEVTNNQKLELPEILYPSYIYKVGDEISWNIFNLDKSKVDFYKFKVTDVKHEVHVESDQVITIYVEEIK